MHQGKLVFAQLIAHLPLSTFRRCVAALRGDYISCLDQFLAMAFAQLTDRESLRAVEVNLRAQSGRLYNMGFRCQTISRNTLANANATRHWQIYADFAQHLITLARPLYAKDPLHIDLDATVYAFDATTTIKGSESLTHLEDKDSDPMPSVYAFDATTAIKGSESLTHLEDKDSDPLPGRQGL